jgi:hypothetical protein
MGKAKAVEGLQPPIVETMTSLKKNVADFMKLKKSAPDSAVEKLRLNRLLAKLSEEIGKGIEQSRRAIKKSATSPPEIKEALSQLRRFENTIKPVRERKPGGR